MQNGNALFYLAEWLAYHVEWWRFQWFCSWSHQSFQTQLSQEHWQIADLNLDDESSIHGDYAHEMEIVEGDIQDDDNTGYESDTSLFKLSNLELERWVKFVADVQMSIILDNRDYYSDNNGKIHFL